MCLFQLKHPILFPADLQSSVFKCSWLGKCQKKKNCFKLLPVFSAGGRFRTSFGWKCCNFIMCRKNALNTRNRKILKMMSQVLGSIHLLVSQSFQRHQHFKCRISGNSTHQSALMSRIASSKLHVFFFFRLPVYWAHRSPSIKHKSSAHVCVSDQKNTVKLNLMFTWGLTSILI